MSVTPPDSHKSPRVPVPPPAITPPSSDSFGGGSIQPSHKSNQWMWVIMGISLFIVLLIAVIGVIVFIIMRPNESSSGPTFNDYRSASTLLRESYFEVVSRRNKIGSSLGEDGANTQRLIDDYVSYADGINESLARSPVMNDSAIKAKYDAYMAEYSEHKRLLLLYPTLSDENSRFMRDCSADELRLLLGKIENMSPSQTQKEFAKGTKVCRATLQELSDSEYEPMAEFASKMSEYYSQVEGHRVELARYRDGEISKKPVLSKPSLKSGMAAYSEEYDSVDPLTLRNSLQRALFQKATANLN